MAENDKNALTPAPLPWWEREKGRGDLIYDEYKLLPQLWAWVLLVLFGASIMGYAMLMHHIVPDPPRYWDHGERPDTPAESVYSTYEPSPIATKKKIVNPLPEGKPLEPENQPPEPGRY